MMGWVGRESNGMTGGVGRGVVGIVDLDVDGG
jgi:hypothetical protein